MVSVLIAGNGFTIDQEFADLCPPLTPEERNLLTASIDAEGCREPLIVWKEEEILLDGHNRFDICSDLDKEYKTRKLSLPNREAAVEWIIANQLGRRNVSEEQKSYLRGKRYKHEKKKVGGVGANQHTEQLGKNGPVAQERTSKRIADELGVGERTIRRDAQFSEAVDRIGENVSKDVKNEILTGRSGLTKESVLEIGAMPATKQAEAVEVAKRGKPAIESENKPGTDRQGVGVIRANEAVNSLSRIPKNDALRKRGFQIVKDWIKANS